MPEIKKHPRLIYNFPKAFGTSNAQYIRQPVCRLYDPVNKIAFSHLIDRGYDDWILDDYVIRDWVESLPERRVSITSLANSYKIIGL